MLFTVNYNDQVIDCVFHRHHTVGDLKRRILEKFQIPSSKQIIRGWGWNYESEADILNTRVRSSEWNTLTVYHIDHDPEKCAAISFINYFANKYGQNSINVLSPHYQLDACIKSAFHVPIGDRKILILYLHNSSKPFANFFCTNVLKADVRKKLQDRFVLLGWNVEKDDFQETLIQAVRKYSELAVLEDQITIKKCTAIFIVPLQESMSIRRHIWEPMPEGQFLEVLKKTEESLLIENRVEEEVNAAGGNPSNSMGSSEYQQLMLNLLGDRDYDSFEFTEHELLRKKIGYALYGQPQETTGYSVDQNKNIDPITKILIEQNNKYSKWKDRVVMSVIYNCAQPLPEEKLKRIKKHGPVYNPRTDFVPVPILVLRKCKKSHYPCRIFIDDLGRVYKSWLSYLEDNKLGQCEMILPRNGRYEEDENGRVLLERHLSPACNARVRILQVADVGSAVAGLASGGVLLAAGVTTALVAPIAVTGAAVAGVGVGVYSVGRSVYNLWDRNTHKESISLSNPEARAAYLNIAAGSFSFLGAGANMAVTQLATRGINIGSGAVLAADMLNISTFIINGTALANSGYDMAARWITENRAPTPLEWLQFTSSLLFFGHSVYTFQGTQTTINEIQSGILSDHRAGLATRRQRQRFNRRVNRAIRRNDGNAQRGRSEIVRSIREVRAQNQVFANSDEARELGMDVNANDGGVTMDGVALNNGQSGQTLDITFTTTTGDATTQPPSMTAVNAVTNRVTQFVKELSATQLLIYGKILAEMILDPNMAIREKIIDVSAFLLHKLLQKCGNYLTLLGYKYVHFITMQVEFLQEMVNELEELYQRWLKDRDSQLEQNIFVIVFRQSLGKVARASRFFLYLAALWIDGQMPEDVLKSWISHAYTFLANTAAEEAIKRERKEDRVRHQSGQSSSKRMKCPECGGYFYSNES